MASRQLRSKACNSGSSDVKAGPTRLGNDPAQKVIRLPKKNTDTSATIIGLKRIAKRILAREFPDRENLRVELGLLGKEFPAYLDGLITAGLLTDAQVAKYLPHRPTPVVQITTADPSTGRRSRSPKK